MKVIIGAAVLAISVPTSASAQQSVGPIAITNQVNGVPITVSATSWITINKAENGAVDARIFVDLIDLQRKLPDVLDKSGPATADCSKRDSDNRSAAVSLKGGTLTPVDDQLIVSVRGNVNVWSCKNKPSTSKIAWKKHKIAFLNIKLPVRQTIKGGFRKTKDGGQSFRENLPVQLVQKDDSNIAPKMAEPEMKLDDRDSVSDSNLNHAKIDISHKIYAALQSAINFVKLKAMLPKELQQSKVVSTRFRSHGGHAIAEIVLASSGSSYTQ